MTATSFPDAQEPHADPSLASQPTEVSRRAGGGVLRFLTPFIGVLAVLAVGLSVAALVTDSPSSLRRQVNAMQRHANAASVEINALRGKLDAASADISSLQNGSQAGTVSTLKGRVQGLQDKVTAFQMCIPELEQQVNGLSLTNSTASDGSNTVNLSSPTIISSNCNKTLYGS